MTVIYNRIHFVMLVQKNSVGNYEPIMRIWGKIFVSNLHNLQMPLMLWIKNKFSECLTPSPNMKAPSGRLSGNSSSQACRHGGAFGDSYPQIFFVPPNFAVLSKNCFKHMINSKIFPQNKFILPPQNWNLATGLVLPKLCLQLEYFVFKVIRPRDVA